MTSKELHRRYRSLNIVREIRSIRLRRPERVARIEKYRSAFKMLIGMRLLGNMKNNKLKFVRF
jgi:hypothetical protein